MTKNSHVYRFHTEVQYSTAQQKHTTPHRNYTAAKKVMMFLNFSIQDLQMRCKLGKGYIIFSRPAKELKKKNRQTESISYILQKVQIRPSINFSAECQKDKSQNKRKKGYNFLLLLLLLSRLQIERAYLVQFSIFFFVVARENLTFQSTPALSFPSLS